MDTYTFLGEVLYFLISEGWVWYILFFGAEASGLVMVNSLHVVFICIAKLDAYWCLPTGGVRCLRMVL